MTNPPRYIDIEQGRSLSSLQNLLFTAEPKQQSAAILLLLFFAAWCFSASSFAKQASEPHINLNRAWLHRDKRESDGSSLSTSLSHRESTDSDDSDDDILEAVSLLFQEEDDELDCEERQRDTGTIVARIISKDRIGYDEKKPLARRRNDPHALRQMIDESDDELPQMVGGFDSRDEDLAESIVVLEVRLSLSLESMAQVALDNRKRDEQHITMKMIREAQEPARKTLRRLHVSINKKLGFKESGEKAYLRSKGKTYQAFPPSRRGANTQEARSLSTEPSVWVRESSSIEASSFKDKVEGGAISSSMRSLNRERSTSQRRLCLSSRVDTPHVPSSENEMKSACLWNELAEFEDSCLYFGIHPTGPLLPLGVQACPPTILSIGVFEDFRSRLYVGVPVVVNLALLHATHALIAWFMEDGQGTPQLVSSTCVTRTEASSSFTPTSNDIGKSITVLVVPKRPGHDGHGYEEAYKFHFPVEALPPMPLVSPLRDSWTAHRTHTQIDQQPLRVVTYNLLADWYAGRAVEAFVDKGKGRASKREGEDFYSYCDGNFLMRNRRFPMLLAEILSYQPDLICLQEVDAAVFDRLLMPALTKLRYQGYFSHKAPLQSEGCAMFWSLQVFERAGEDEMRKFHLRDCFCESKSGASNKERATKGDPWQECTASIQQLLETNPGLRDVLTSKVGQVVQVAALRPRRDGSTSSQVPNMVVVGNTHLFYHPMADHIRALQAYQVCHKLETVRRQFSGQGDVGTPLILCGDLNSHPLSGAVQLLLQGRLGADHFEAWKNLNAYSWEMGGQEYLLEHGYIGSNEGDDSEPAFVNESFEDASEELPEEADDIGEAQSNSGQQQRSGLNLSFPSTFPRLISGYPEIPEFSNFSVGFAETLDYIMASEPSINDEFGFEAVGAAPMPTTAFMQDYGAMPNEFMPSDHISLVCDLAWVRHL